MHLLSSLLLFYCCCIFNSFPSFCVVFVFLSPQRKSRRVRCWCTPFSYLISPSYIHLDPLLFSNLFSSCRPRSFHSTITYSFHVPRVEPSTYSCALYINMGMFLKTSLLATVGFLSLVHVRGPPVQVQTLSDTNSN